MSASEVDTLYGSSDVDGALSLWLDSAGVREMYRRSSALHDLLDVRSSSTDHKQVVLRRDLQLYAHRYRHLQGQRQGARFTKSAIEKMAFFSQLCSYFKRFQTTLNQLEVGFVLSLFWKGFGQQ